MCDTTTEVMHFDFCPFLYMPLTHNIGQSRPPISVSQVMTYESKEDISLMYVVCMYQRSNTMQMSIQ